MAGVTGCAPADNPDRIDVSVIGIPRLGDPDRDTLDTGRATLMRETAMGLVALDAAGQVEPALGESWIVTDDGLSTIFRIRRMNWPDGREVSGQDVAASLNRAIAANSENRLKPLLSAIDSVVGMTGRVVEIRLKVPRPNLLQLLAQPELGIRRKGAGLGPWRIAARDGSGMVLRPVADIAENEPSEAPKDNRTVHLKGERAALAVARFMARRTDIVLGGTLADWPVVQNAGIRGGTLRRDPVEGLFGLAILPRTTFLKEKDLREALAMAIDRSALTGAFAISRWSAIDRLLPSQLDSGQAPSSPDWVDNTLTERRAVARQRVAAWVRVRGAVEPLRIALPSGPGMQLLFARLSADWRDIGIKLVAIAGGADADLRLIDEVAPNASANWYLTRTGCTYGLACSTTGDFALRESRIAPTLGQRSAALARADAAYAANAAYIPLARPVRWSLASPVLTRYRDNSFAAHPFAELRPELRN